MFYFITITKAGFHFLIVSLLAVSSYPKSLKSDVQFWYSKTKKRYSLEIFYRCLSSCFFISYEVCTLVEAGEGYPRNPPLNIILQKIFIWRADEETTVHHPLSHRRTSTVILVKIHSQITLVWIRMIIFRLGRFK